MNQHTSKFCMPGASRIIKIFFFVFVATTFVQCAKDEDPNESINNKIDGTWNVESFRVDGEEQIQYTISSFEMDYNKETVSTGKTKWTLIDVFGATSVTSGDYEIMNDGNRIDIDGDEFNIEVDGDFMTIDGNIGGYFWEIDAEKE